MPALGTPFNNGVNNLVDGKHVFANIGGGWFFAGDALRVARKL